MPDRNSSTGRQQGGMNRGIKRQQSQDIGRDGRQQSSSGTSRKQQPNRSHRSQQR